MFPPTVTVVALPPRLRISESYSADLDAPCRTAPDVAFEVGQAEQLDPVIAAAILAFGFVYIHPFEDGNGRIHRYLIHHILSKRGFNPPQLVFPVSAAILDRIEDYRGVLED